MGILQKSQISSHEGYEPLEATLIEAVPNHELKPY